MRSLFLIGLALLIFGCVTPTSDQLYKAYYGPYPDDYKALIVEYMSVVLKDPYSADYLWGGTPSKVWTGGTFFMPIQYGWGMCAYINAKNIYGGYVGYKKYFFLIRSDKVINFELASPVGNPCGNVVR